MRTAITVLALLLLTLPVSAATILVPHDQPTIQQAINAAAPGDVVTVADGTWTGPGNVRLDFKGKAITVRSSNGPMHCILDMENATRGAVFDKGEGPDSVLEGFTLLNGYAPMDGGGILVTRDCSPTITRNIIEQCSADRRGGAIYVMALSSAVITSNLIQYNQAASGGGIGLEYGNPVVTSNRIMENSATSEGGGLLCIRTNPELVNNLLHQNHAGTEGGAIHVTGMNSAHDPVTLASTTLDNNTTGGECGGLFCRNCQVDVIDSIFTFNDGYGIQVGDESAGAYVHIEYSMVLGGLENVYVEPGSAFTRGDGTFSAPPRYSQGPLGGHYLQSSSQCIDAGSDDVVNICFSGTGGPVCMDELTTGATGLLDYGTVDLGYHYPIGSLSLRTLWGRVATTPPAGLLPVYTRFWLLIRQSTTPTVDRTAAINIGLRTAGGQYFPNWRTGTATITEGIDTLEIWTLNLPNTWSFVGENQFLLRLVDVTPAPYNLPPYQPSGGTAIDTFIFTGIEPGGGTAGD